MYFNHTSKSYSEVSSYSVLNNFSSNYYLSIFLFKLFFKSSSKYVVNNYLLSPDVASSLVSSINLVRSAS